MKISHTTVEPLNAKITLQIEKDDYQKQVNEKLKERQKNVQMNGFRKGKVPMGLVKKMYGNAVLADELNTLISKNLSSYIKDNKLNILGEPLPSEEERKPIDWKKDENFTFSFDIGLSPEVSLDFTNINPLNQYYIKVDKSMIDEEVERITKQYAKSIKAEIVQDKDIIKVDIVEQGATNSLQKKDTIIDLNYMEDNVQKEKLIGKKTGDKLSLDIKESFKNLTDLSALLGIKKERIEQLSNEFEISIKEINRFIPTKVDEKLFEKIYGKEKKVTKEDFYTNVKEQLTSYFQQQSESKLNTDVKEYLQKTTILKLPVKFLKRWLININEKISKEEIDKHFEQSLEEIKWTLIKNKIKEKEDIKVADNEINELARSFILANYAQYGIYDLTEQNIEALVSELLKNDKEKFRLENQVAETKIFAFLKGVIPLKEKSLNMDEFMNMLTKKN